MKHRIAIVGAGLGGCVLADRLAESHDVTIIELGTEPPLLRERVVDLDYPATTNPHIASGLGGTTTVWHNGLIEIDADVFQERWPFAKPELAPYYREAFEDLSGQGHDILIEGTAKLVAKYCASGFSRQDLGAPLYYPKTRVNAWQLYGLETRVKLVWGGALRLLANSSGRIRGVVVKQGGREYEIGGETFVLAAGGLATPILLQNSAGEIDLPAIAHAGLHYEDHPCAVVGELLLDEPLYRMWNFPCAKGNLRLPFIVKHNGLKVSFQLRPSAHFRVIAPSANVKSVLSDLRNTPLAPMNYLKLLSHWDDIMDILSFKLGVHLPTYRYTIMMVAEQPAADCLAVWGDAGKATICRKWTFEQHYIDALSDAIGTFQQILGARIRVGRIFSDWPKAIYSSSHHSGTARMGSSVQNAVCDLHGQVFGVPNLFICDGSAIPASGYANTGLTIAALAIRLSDYIRSRG